MTWTKTNSLCFSFTSVLGDSWVIFKIFSQKFHHGSEVERLTYAVTDSVSVLIAVSKMENVDERKISESKKLSLFLIPQLLGNLAKMHWEDQRVLLCQKSQLLSFCPSFLQFPRQLHDQMLYESAKVLCIKSVRTSLSSMMAITICLLLTISHRPCAHTELTE